MTGRREVRRAATSTGLEVRTVNGAPVLAGYACVTEFAYDVGSFSEIVRRGAFTKTLNERPDVVLLLSHEGLPLARTTSGTLHLSEDDRGLRVDAELDPDDPDVQRLLPKVRRGDLCSMSFAFRAVRQSFDEDYENRVLLEVSLDHGDVSVVTTPANSAASFSMSDARAFLAELERPVFDDLVRSVDDAPDQRLEFYRAKAFALKLAGQARNG